MQGLTEQQKEIQKNLYFCKMKPEHLDGVIDCLYQAWKDNAWIKQGGDEKTIRQSFYDRINHPGIMDFTYLCINKKDGKVLGVVFGQRMSYYLQNNMKWKFHKHFEIVEELIESLAKEWETMCDPDRAVFGFWMASLLPKAKIPEALICLAAQPYLDNGYFYHLVFTNHPKTAHIQKKFAITYLKPTSLQQLKKGNFSEDVAFYPSVGDIEKSMPFCKEFIKSYFGIVPKL